jgi:hypothetical protein
MWKLVLDERPGEVDPIRLSHKIHRRFAVNGTPRNLEEDKRTFAALSELARQGVKTSGRMATWSKNTARNLPAIKTGAQMISDIDEEIALKGLTHKACHPLTFMFRQGKENLEEGDVAVLSRKTLHLYETLLREATLMYHGLEQTMACLERIP